MQHKLIMTWDITEGKEQEYFDFLVHTFVPRMNQLGFELTDAWATIYGDCPQVLVTAILPDELEALGLPWLDNEILQELRMLAKLSSRTEDRARFDFSVLGIGVHIEGAKLIASNEEDALVMMYHYEK